MALTARHSKTRCCGYLRVNTEYHTRINTLFKHNNTANEIRQKTSFISYYVKIYPKIHTHNTLKQKVSLPQIGKKVT